MLSLDQLSCSHIWNIEKEKGREKEKVGDRPAKLNEKKSDRELELEIKNKGDIRAIYTRKNKTRSGPFIRACLI